MRSARRTMLWVSLLAALGAFACAMAYRWLERGGAFDLATVRVRGIRGADSTVVCMAVAPLFGRPIWRISTDSLESSLEQLPGIAGARVSRVPFDTILLTITLEMPVYAISEGSMAIPVSAAGERLPVSFLSDTIPVIHSYCPMDSSASASIGEWFSMAGTGDEPVSLEYGGDGVAVRLQGGCRIILGSGALPERWNRFTELCRTMPEAAGWSEVDMRYGGQAVLRGGG